MSHDDQINQHCKAAIKGFLAVALTQADKTTVDPLLTNMGKSIGDAYAKLQTLEMLQGGGLASIMGGQHIDSSQLGEVFSGVTAAKNASRGAAPSLVPNST